MSVLFKGKNVENLNRDTLEAMRYIVERTEKHQKILELFETARVARKDIYDMVEKGELTEEEGCLEVEKLIHEVNKEKHRIEQESFVEAGK